MPPKLADALRVLGLSAGASLDEAKVAYRRLALRWHPDKCGAPDAAERFLEIQDAFAAVTQSTGLDAEAEALLRDPLADLLGANWARGFADGTIDPNAAFESAPAARSPISAAPTRWRRRRPSSGWTTTPRSCGGCWS